MNLNELRAEIESGPLADACAPLVADGDDAGVAALLNAIEDSISITRNDVSRSEIIKGTQSALIVLAGKSFADQTKWDRILRSLYAVEAVDCTDAGTQAMFGLAVSESLLTGEQVETLTTRAGSRAEERWGVGTVVRHSDVARAMRGGDES